MNIDVRGVRLCTSFSTVRFFCCWRLRGLFYCYMIVINAQSGVGTRDNRVRVLVVQRCPNTGISSYFEIVIFLNLSFWFSDKISCFREYTSVIYLQLAASIFFTDHVPVRIGKRWRMISTVMLHPSDINGHSVLVNYPLSKRSFIPQTCHLLFARSRGSLYIIYKARNNTNKGLQFKLWDKWRDKYLIITLLSHIVVQRKLLAFLIETFR